MDVIKTQASTQIAVSYIATGVAFLALLFVYPLDLGAYGLAQFLSMTAMFLMPFVTLGAYATVVKFFPEFQNSEYSKSYLLYILAASTVAMLVVFGVGYVTRQFVYTSLDSLGFDVELIQTNIWPLILITFFIVIGKVATMHAANYNKTAVPTFYNQLFPKLVLPALILLLYGGLIGLENLVWLWTISFGIAAAGQLAYLRTIGGLDIRWDWQGITRDFLKRLTVYSGFTGLSMVGSVLANRLDVIMVTLLLGEEENGIYLIAMFIASVMQIPTGAVWQITSPQIATAWESNDREHISKLYKRSSSNLFVSGVLVYFIFLGTIDSVFQLTANYSALQAGVIVFALLGVARLFDMITSINTQILMYSQSYKVNTVFVVILGVLNVALNYLLINKYGLMGAALATLIAVVVYNLLKTFYLYFKYDLSPWSADMTRIFVIGCILGLFYYYFPSVGNPILQVLVYSVSIMVLFLLLIYLFGVSTDFIPFFRLKAIEILRKLLRRWTE